jgi:hypothetical protein
MCEILTNENFIRIYLFLHDGWIELIELHKKKMCFTSKNEFYKKISKIRVLGLFAVIYEDNGVVDFF